MAWQIGIADLRIHGTTHQRPIDRFADEAAHLLSTARQPSFLQAMVRERVVAEDWLVSLDGNRYSVPFALIGKTVQVVREGALWVMRQGGREVARHEVLAGKAQLSVLAQHGPRASRPSSPLGAPAGTAPRETSVHRALNVEVEVRELATYEQLVAAREAA